MHLFVFCEHGSTLECVYVVQKVMRPMTSTLAHPQNAE